MLRTALIAAVGLTVLTAPAMAGAPAPTPVSKDPKAVAAGTYKLDERHVGVIARIPHGGGTSYSVFRFDVASGSLTVDAANPNNSKVTITIDPKSIKSNVAGFGDELAGDRYLNAAKFATATFTSTGVKASGAKADVTGDLMLMGVTKPITAHMELVGSGQSRGKPVVGFTGTAKFKRSDFGFTALMGPIGDDVELTIDAEFIQG
ncbi:MAG: YceI family protein [Caulobacteraceae bacterium]